MSSRLSYRKTSRSNDWDSFSDDNLRGTAEPRGKFRGVGNDAPPRQTVPVYERSDPLPARNAVASNRRNINATVSWFNVEKGFGFAADEEGRGLFVHSSVLRSLGLSELLPGAKLLVDVAQSDKGEKVIAIHSVTNGDPCVVSSAPGGDERRAEGRPTSYRAQPLSTVTGVVKWYNSEKGFGFMSPADGSKDIFIHASALERSRVTALTEGAAVSADVVVGRSGKTEVGTIRLI